MQARDRVSEQTPIYTRKNDTLGAPAASACLAAAAILEQSPEIYREHDLSQLALAIGSGPAVAAGQHYVVEVDRLLSGRRDVHDPRWRAVLDKRQQQGHEAGNRDGEIERPDDRLQIGQAARKRIDRHDVAVAGCRHSTVGQLFRAQSGSAVSARGSDIWAASAGDNWILGTIDGARSALST
jgi:hypothetical protein